MSSLRDKQASWNREKQSLEKNIAELTARVKDQTEKLAKGTSIELERARLKASLQDKTEELVQARKECDMQRDQLEYMRKEVIILI